MLVERAIVSCTINCNLKNKHYSNDSHTVGFTIKEKKALKDLLESEREKITETHALCP